MTDSWVMSDETVERVKSIAYTVLSTDEAIVDGFGMRQVFAQALGMEPRPLTPDEQALYDAAAARLRVKDAEREARWRALPVWTRASIRLRVRLYEPRHRLRHALAALRGIDCEP